MKHFFQTKAWVCYAFTFFIIAVLFLLRNTDQRVVGVAGHFGFTDIGMRIAVIGISFIVASYMGYKNIYSKILFPILVTLFAYLILPIIQFFAYEHAEPYYFMYYLVLGFIFIFIPHIILAFIGLSIGVLFRKCKLKNNNALSKRE